MRFVLETSGGARGVEAAVEDLVIAGWTGRDAGAVEAHIAELAAIGVARPPRIPCFYRVSAALATTAPAVQVQGAESSGEVEFVLYGTADGMLVGLGSDHTDRKVEAWSVSVSKQMCAKPVSGSVWRFEDVADHWDSLILRSWAVIDGARELYQEGAVSAMRAPDDLIARYTGGAAALPAGTAMFGGTLAVRGGVRPAGRFEMEISDPVSGRGLRHGYDVAALPAEG